MSSVILGIYIFLFIYAYENFAVVLYSNLRLVSEADNRWELYYAIALTAGVMWLLPHNLKDASDFFSWFIFSIVFVPAMTISSVVGNLPSGSYLLTSLLAVSFTFIIFVPRLIVLPSFKTIIGSGHNPARIIAAISILSSIIIVIEFRSIMNFSGIENIYDQRDLAKQFGIGRLTGYVLNWQYNVFGAFLLAYGLRTRRSYYVLLSLQAFMIIYMVNGTKIVFAVVSMMFVVHFLLNAKAASRPFLLMIPPMAVSFLIVAFLQFRGLIFTDAMLFFLSQAYMRGIAIQGALIPIYVEFFEVNPVTYYSHVTGVSAFLDYPYSESIGYVIGYYVNNNPAYNANSNFWATDGIASFGILGIPIVGLIVGLLLSLINALTRTADKTFLWIAMVPLMMAVANTSIFTSLMTSGGLILFILARFVLPQEIASSAARS